MTEEPDTRVGDRERAEVDARLRAAHDDGVLTLVEYDERSRDCFAARFRRDLDVLVADLPLTRPPPKAAPTVHADIPAVDERRPARRHEGRRSGRRGLARLVPVAVVAVVALVVGPGVLGADQGAAVFGGRTVQVSQGTAEVGVLFGGVTVVVPDGTRVATSGTVLFGGVNCEQACTAVLPPGAPEVAVSARGAFGGVTVESASEAVAGGLSGRDRHPDD